VFAELNKYEATTHFVGQTGAGSRDRAVAGHQFRWKYAD
jgi:hypothetical protein